MKATECVVEAQNILKAFGEKTVLSDVSLKLFRGEIFGFLGPNAAGKSTLMKILMGLERADSGRVLFFGKRFDLFSKHLIGIVPQEDFFYGQFSVRENLSFFGLLNNIYGLKLKKRVDFVVKWLGLEGFENTRAELLSGGYRKLLNIGCSIVHDPQVIFLDEPTVALDPLIRSSIWEKISELREQKKSVFLTTHYLDEAEKLCDRVAILFDGKILVEDSPASLVEKYGGKEIIRLGFEEKTLQAGEFIRENFPNYSVQVKEEEIIIVVPKKMSFEALGKISEALSKKGFVVFSSTIKEPSIEDVFLSLTSARRVLNEKTC